MTELNIFRQYPDRKLLTLEELIEIRTNKVNELIANIPSVQASGFANVVKQHLNRIDEYSSIVNYLNELKYYKDKEAQDNVQEVK